VKSALTQAHTLLKQSGGTGMYATQIQIGQGGKDKMV
jgi:hypothetical protein